MPKTTSSFQNVLLGILVQFFSVSKFSVLRCFHDLNQKMVRLVRRGGKTNRPSSQRGKGRYFAIDNRATMMTNRSTIVNPSTPPMAEKKWANLRTFEGLRFTDEAWNALLLQTFDDVTPIYVKA